LRFELLAFAAAGVGLFLWLLHRIGLEAVARNLARIGWDSHDADLVDLGFYLNSKPCPSH
jgi:hypothetical protein